MSRLSLRARLVLGVIVLAAAGLAVANVATYTSLRSFLLDRTDESLREAGRGLERFVAGPACGRGHRPPPGAEPGDFVQLRNDGGEAICTLQITGFSGEPASPPRLPASFSVAEDARGP